MARTLLIDPENFNTRYNFACALSVHLKDKPAALNMLESAFAMVSEVFLPYAKEDPDLDFLRDDPRYQAGGGGGGAAGGERRGGGGAGLSGSDLQDVARAELSAKGVRFFLAERAWGGNAEKWVGIDLSAGVALAWLSGKLDQVHVLAGSLVG